MLRRIASLFKGCLLLVISAATVAACVLGVAAGLHVGDEPDTLDVSVQIEPATVGVGDRFTLTLTVTNRDQEAVNMTGIGLDESLLAGAVVQESTPAFRGIKARSYPVYGDWQEFRLTRRIGPEEMLTLTFVLEGTQPGSYSGSLTLWIEGEVMGLFPLDRAWRDKIAFDVY